MPDLVFPLDNLHNLKIYFDVSLFPMTAIFKVCFHQQGNMSSPSKCEENLPAICVRTHLGTSTFVCRLVEWECLHQEWVQSAEVRTAYAVKVLQRMLCPFCIIIRNSFLLSSSKTLLKVVGHKEVVFSCRKEVVCSFLS